MWGPESFMWGLQVNILGPEKNNYGPNLLYRDLQLRKYILHVLWADMQNIFS